MARRAAEVVIRSAEWHIGRLRPLSDRWSDMEGGEGRYLGGGVTQRAAEVVIRSVERYGGRLRSLSGRWIGAESG